MRFSHRPNQILVNSHPRIESSTRGVFSLPTFVGIPFPAHLRSQSLEWPLVCEFPRRLVTPQAQQKVTPMSRVLLLSLLLIFPSTLSAADVFVSPGGNDQAPGTIDRPFRTIQRAVDGMAPGDTCWLREGVYRETVTLKQSGTKERPIHIRAYPGELPILDGTEPIAGPWRRERDGIFAAKTAIKTAQLFANDEMLVEARWPNCTPDKMLTREGWMLAGPKSEYQKIHSTELAKTGADWNGALAVLNVAHQFWTWSRVVEGYTAGSEFLPYTITMNEFHTKNRRWWDDDYFYLQGKREALDAAGEWLQTANGTLLLIPPPGAEPEMLQLKAKQRDYGFVGTNLHHVQISGITFFGCTFRLTTCEDCLVEFCNLSYPSYARGVPNAEEKGKTRPCPGTYISGRRNTIRSCSFEHCPNYGVLLGGEQNVIENSIVHDVNWAGTLHYTAVALTAGKEIAKPRNVARGNTLYNVGNSIITCHGPESIVEYNHVHHGGLISSDVSLIYTSMPSADGLEFRYNWVHDSLSPNHSLGIRGDDKTRGLHVHHNVVWNTAKDGIITKGGRNRVYNNTCFANGASDICYNSGREPDKWWQQHVKAYQNQNEDSLLINNAAPAIVSTRHRLQPPLPGDASNNFTERDARLMDVEKFDFRPQSDSPLVDAGRAVAGITAPFQGKAPDIGAYEFGGENWRPGHHNGIWLSRVAGDFSVRLNLPILEPVLARVTRNGQTLASLQFTPENWSQTQALPTAQILAGSGPLSFAVDDWGTAVVPDVAAVTGLADTRALFSRSDITSAKVVDSRPKFNYELSYTADLVVRPAWRAYFTKTPPTVDGIIRSSEWPGWDAARSITLVGNDTQADNAVAGEGYALFDGKDLYLAVKVANDGNPPSQSAEVWGQSGTDGIELAFARMSHGRANQNVSLACLSIRQAGSRHH